MLREIEIHRRFSRSEHALNWIKVTVCLLRTRDRHYLLFGIVYSASVSIKLLSGGWMIKLIKVEASVAQLFCVYDDIDWCLSQPSMCQ